MAEKNDQNQAISFSFYEKYIQHDENVQAKVKPILNQIQENRGKVHPVFEIVAVKELHIQFGVKFSQFINSYRNRLEDLKKQNSEMQTTQNAALSKCNEMLEDLKSRKN